MPGTKEIRSKIVSVKNTQKITKAMQMVATSKMRRAQERMKLARPYAQRMRNVIGHLTEANPDYRHPFLVTREPKTVGLIVISTDRGLAGALNTMYSSVAARASEIATLRAIGFGGFSAFVGTIVESLILAAIGGLIGALVTFLFFDGLTTSTLGASFTQVVFSFRLSPALIVQGVLLALVVGAIGGLFPALRAARMPIVAGLSE